MEAIKEVFENYLPVFKNLVFVVSLIVGCTWYFSSTESRQDLTEASIVEIRADVQEIKKNMYEANARQDEEYYRFQQNVLGSLVRMEDKIEKVYDMQMNKRGAK
jgi:hypothetical protein